MEPQLMHCAYALSICSKSHLKDIVPDPSIDCFNQCEYLPRENNSLSNKVDW